MINYPAYRAVAAFQAVGMKELNTLSGWKTILPSPRTVIDIITTYFFFLPYIKLNLKGSFIYGKISSSCDY